MPKSNDDIQRVQLLHESNAFRQTFLSAMPPERAEVFRAFGETMYEYGLEMTRYSPVEPLSHTRRTLMAVLVDLEYLELFLRESVDPSELQDTADEARLAGAAEEQRQKLSEIVKSISAALQSDSWRRSR